MEEHGQMDLLRVPILSQPNGQPTLRRVCTGRTDTLRNIIVQPVLPFESK